MFNLGGLHILSVQEIEYDDEGRQIVKRDLTEETLQKCLEFPEEE